MLLIKRPDSVSIFLLFGVLFSVLFTASSILYLDGVEAEPGWSWVGEEEPVAVLPEDVPDPDLNYIAGSGRTNQCVNESVFIGNLNLAKEDVCVYQAVGFRYGFVSGSRSMVVSMPGDSRMYRVAGVPSKTEDVINIPNSPHMAWRNRASWTTIGYRLMFVDNFASQLRRVVNEGMAVSYELNSNAVKQLGNIDGHQEYYVGAVGVSSNGRWLLAEFREGIVRYDTQESKLYYFSTYGPSYYSWNGHRKEFAITDDGSYVAVAGLYATPRVYDLSDNCGVDIVSFEHAIAIKDSFTECPSRDLSSVLSGLRGQYYNHALIPKFDYDGGELMLWSVPYYTLNMPEESVWVKITAADYVAPRLDYLALGDSYSSGEGDLELDDNGDGYYTTFSQVPGINDKLSDRCHLSKRSYSYIIRDARNISPDRMASVACSGARILPDYRAPIDNYMGQGAGLLSIPVGELALTKQTALDNNIPGHIPQIEFVRKYRPRLITLTGGGNDVGFGAILEYCAAPSIEGAVLDNTCAYAKEGSELQRALYDSIDTQYEYTLSLLKDIKDISPISSVKVIGYPSFIANASLLPCAMNGGSLNTRERKMINSAVSYINDMLQSAAYESGAEFIDIEDSLDGGRLCEGGDYVTGLHDLGFDKILTDDLAESFHPNAAGHRKMAEAIFRQLSQGSGLQVSAGEYSPANDFTKTLPLEDAAFTGSSAADQPVVLSVPINTFAPESVVKIRMYSDPQHLGSFISTVDGALHVSIPSDGLVNGRHVLVFTGNQPSGEPVRYLQHIEIQLIDSDDVEDRVSDTVESQCTAELVVSSVECQIGSPDQPDEGIAIVVINETSPSLLHVPEAGESLSGENNPYHSQDKGEVLGLEDEPSPTTAQLPIQDKYIEGYFEARAILGTSTIMIPAAILLISLGVLYAVAAKKSKQV